MVERGGLWFLVRAAVARRCRVKIFLLLAGQHADDGDGAWSWGKVFLVDSMVWAVNKYQHRWWGLVIDDAVVGVGVIANLIVSLFW